MLHFARVIEPWRTSADRKERRGTEDWCPGAESNHRHCDFQSHALPTELPGRRGPPEGRAKQSARFIEAGFRPVQTSWRVGCRQNRLIAVTLRGPAALATSG